MLKSLSVRIAESPRDKTRLATAPRTLFGLASKLGFDGVCLRASAISVESTATDVAALSSMLTEFRLTASMVTGDISLAANNANANAAIRNIGPYVDLAEALGARFVRVMLHTKDDITHAQRAADHAAERSVVLLQQTHWGSLAETVNDCVKLCRAVDRPNFGLTFEPANLLACVESLDADVVKRLSPYIRNIYFQNIALAPKSNVVFPTRSQGPVGIEFLPLFDERGIDLAPIMSAVKEYVAEPLWFTLHQPQLPGQDLEQAIREAGRFAAQF